MTVVAEEETKRACSRTKLILEGSESTECFGYDFFSTTEDSDATEMTSPCINDADKQEKKHLLIASMQPAFDILS